MDKWADTVSSEMGEEEREAESSAEGRRVSAITRRIGAEKRSRETSIVMRKKTVFTALRSFLDFSSFGKKPMSAKNAGRINPLAG